MSFQNPKIKVTGLVFQNKLGNKYYSNYYLTKREARPDYDLTLPETQKKFEAGIRNKVQRMNIMSTLKPEQTEIFTYESYTVLFKLIDELQIYLIVSDDQNFVLMENVVNLMGDVLLMVTKGPFTGKIIFDYLQDIVVIADQIIHEGYIVCLEANTVFDRLKMKQGASSAAVKQQQAGEQQQQQKPGPTSYQQQATQAVTGTFSSIFGFAKNTLGKTLNLG